MTEGRRLKCKCASRPRVVLGTTTKLPIRHSVAVAGKEHPAIEGPYGFITLFRCTVCDQHWQADGLQGSSAAATSLPQVCIKIDSPDMWQQLDDMPLRLAYFAEALDGVAKGRRCGTPKCNRLPVRSLMHCASCACALRDRGVTPLRAPV